MITVLGIDPGQTGALVWLNEVNRMEFEKMPVNESGIDFETLRMKLSTNIRPVDELYLERAVSFGMGTKSAFNYGRGFAAIEIAVQLSEIPVTYVEPNAWARWAHAGIDKRLKPKEKSLIAVKRLYPKLIKQIPTNRNGKLHEGVIDALLIAGYGLQQLKGMSDL